MITQSKIFTSSQNNTNDRCIFYRAEIFLLSVDIKFHKCSVLEVVTRSKQKVIFFEKVYAYECAMVQLYQHLLHSILTHILVLFSPPAFSLYKKLLWFVPNVPENSEKIQKLRSFNINPMGQNLLPPSICIANQEKNNLVLHKF